MENNYSPIIHEDEKSSFSKGLLVNEFDYLIKDFGVHFGWSIDRITIVGKLKEDITYYVDDRDIPFFVDFERLMRLNEDKGFLKAVGLNGWQIVDKFGENIAYIEMLKFQKGYGRIDFNPNKISEFLADSMKSFIHKMFLEPHFSRADVACDIIGVPDDFISQYRIIDPVSFKPIYGRSGTLETAYWGSRTSERQVRMYNKKLEQKNKRKIVPEEVSSWWQWEAQLRRDKASNWNDIIQESLSSFCSPHFLSNDVKVTDKMMITALIAEPSYWGQIHRNSKYKYRELLKQEVVNDELTLAMKETFEKSSEDLKRELDTWLQGLDVTEIVD
ncbi:TPA: replication initiation factor domain-containing protein [Streptococcus suis]|nr:replication initiation factor domain-containing protein [Streptococcus suis]